MTEKNILVLFYSLGGGTSLMAQEIAAGASEITNTNVQIKRVPELISKNILDNMHDIKESQEKLVHKFEEAKIEDMVEADGVAFGTPVHFGSFASQIKQFIDQLSEVWIQKKMVGKPASVFCTSGSLHGGEELTLISLMIPLLNLGMVPIGIPYPIQGEGPNFDAGSPYGTIFVNKDQKHDQLPENVKIVARILGNRLATATHLLTCDCNDCKPLNLNFH